MLCFVTLRRWHESPLCLSCAEQNGEIVASLSLTSSGGFVWFTLGWAPPYSINPAFCQSYFCLGSLADPRWVVLDLVPKWAQMWVELKSYQFRCMQGYFPKDVSSGKKRNGAVAVFITLIFEFSGVDMAWISVADLFVDVSTRLGRWMDAMWIYYLISHSLCFVPIVCRLV